MRKIVLLLLSLLLLANSATALAKWSDRDIVERIRVRRENEARAAEAVRA